jgi:hypothetical protein
VLALPSLAVLDGPWVIAILAALGISAVYTLLRKPLVRLADRVVPRIPQDVFDRLPARVASFVAAYR